MSLTIDLPADLETALREQWSDLEAKVRQDLIVAAYHAGKITAGHTAQLLGLPDRLSLYPWLAERQIPTSYCEESYEQDHASNLRWLADREADREAGRKCS